MSQPAENGGTTSSYIDIAKLTADDFKPAVYANTLVLSTNNPNDTAGIDLTTPLSRALFDLQEIDSNIHTLTSTSALEIIEYTASQNQAAQRILERVEQERKVLNESYARLQKEVLAKYEDAVHARLGAERSLQVVGLGKNVVRILGEGRKFESLMAEANLGGPTGGKREDHKAVVKAARAVLEFREVMMGKDAIELARVNVVRQVRGRIFEDGEARILDFARRVVREFSVASMMSAAGPTFKDSEEAKARFTSAVHILYLLSPAPRIDGSRMLKEDFEPEYLLRSLQTYLQTAVTSSAAGIGRALGQLPTLDKALVEVSARCQNIIAFEVLLSGIPPPGHPLLRQKTTESKVQKDEDDLDLNLDDLALEEHAEEESSENLLDPLLTSLDTASLASYFWRSLASSLTAKVQEILGRGGVAARTLKSNKDILRSEIRDCVLRGSKMPSTVLSHGRGGKEEVVGNWEREAAVMVGSIVGPLNR